MAPNSIKGGEQLIQEYLKLSTTNVSDALDFFDTGGAPLGIAPLWPECRKIVGRAVTMKLVPVGEADASPVLGTLEAINTGHGGDILVIDQGGRTDVNSFGGIAGFTAVHNGFAGVVIDGVTRDVDDMKAMGLPVYGKGVIQSSIRNRCAFGGHGIEVQLAGTSISPGDLIMADDNGVVIVPGALVDQVLEQAREFWETEERIKIAIKEGVDPIESHRRVSYDQMTRRK